MFLRKSVWNDERGEAIAEYGLIIALIAMLLIGVMIAINGGTSNIVENVSGSIKNSGK